MSQKPDYVGWFEEGYEPDDYPIEMLVIERSVPGSHAWTAAGALIREPHDVGARWVEEHIDGHWTDPDPALLWEYLVDRSGGNAYTWEVAFLRLRTADDAPAVIQHLDTILQQGHPLGLDQVPPIPDIRVDDAVAEDQEPDEDPCQSHTHVDMPLRAADALTWQIAVQLVRRHPADLWIIRTYPFDGFYDCLSIRRLPHVLSSPSIALNRRGTHVNVGHFDGDEAEESPLMSWGDPLHVEDPATWIRDLEALAGLKPPSGRLPPSTRSSLALRWIAQFMASALGTRQYWTAWNDWNGIDNDEPSQDLVAIPGAAEWARHQGDQFAAARVWLIGTQARAGRAPKAAICSDGMLWIGDQDELDVAKSYRALGSSLQALVAQTAAPLVAS